MDNGIYGFLVGMGVAPKILWSVIGVWMFCGGPFELAAQASAPPCVRIYYDRSRTTAYGIGRAHAISLENLLGHFPEFTPLVSAVEDYKSGDIDQCSVTFYLGSYYDNEIPQAFLTEFAATRRTAVWMGYSIWKYEPEVLSRMIGRRYRSLAVLDSDHRDKKGRPTFYRDIQYKGETFSKYGEFTKPDVFSGTPDCVELDDASGTGGVDSEVLATAIHGGTGRKTPYVVRKHNHYYFADDPFSFIDESDRYLIVADLLFDILGAKERHPGIHPALFRLEDISSQTRQDDLNRTVAVLERLKVPLNLAVIPVFADPFRVLKLRNGGKSIEIDQDAPLSARLGELQRAGATIIWHGVTHQGGVAKNPINGLSGTDFEFWDVKRQAPMPGDSAEWVSRRLERGRAAFKRAGLSPELWETPHYQASPVDSRVFAHMFHWTIGRGFYAEEKSPLEPEGKPEGQFFPYEIYRDSYGARVLPENLGDLDATADLPGVKHLSIEEFLANAKRNRVIRDSWASFYFHPYSIRGGVDIGRVVERLQGLGYTFISAEKFARENP